MLGRIVNFNNGDSVVRATVVRENTDPDDETRVYLWAPERGSGHITLVKGESDRGVPRRAPADYDDADPPGGGLTYHEIDEEAQ